MKPQPAGSIIKLRRGWWDGPEPEPGNYLRTERGRVYEIKVVNGKILSCRVMGKDEPMKYPCRVFEWRWAPRNKRRGRRFSPLLD